MALGTLAVCSSADFWALLATVLYNARELLADMLDTLSTGAADSCDIAKVGIDSYNISIHAVCFEPSDDDISGTTVLRAVAAGSEHFSNIDNGVVLDRG